MSEHTAGTLFVEPIEADAGTIRMNLADVEAWVRSRSIGFPDEGAALTLVMIHTDKLIVEWGTLKKPWVLTRATATIEWDEARG